MLKWKIIFWVSIALLASRVASLPYENHISFIDFLMLAFSGISLIPAYGYAHQIAIGNRKTAILIFALNLPFALFLIGIFPYMAITEPRTEYLYMASLAIPLTLIIISPQFMYAFKSEKLWRVGV